MKCLNPDLAAGASPFPLSLGEPTPLTPHGFDQSTRLFGNPCGCPVRKPKGVLIDFSQKFTLLVKNSTALFEVVIKICCDVFPKQFSQLMSCFGRCNVGYRIMTKSVIDPRQRGPKLSYFASKVYP